MNNTCPKCGAPLQPEAQFCPHCMTSLCAKTEIAPPKPKKKKTTVLLALIAVVAVLICAGTGLFVKQQSKRHAPLCSFAQFSAAAPIVSEKMGVDTLWDLDSLIDTHYSAKTKFRQYAVDTYVGDALLSLFFYNEGEEIGAYFCDVTAENRDKAESLLKCVVQSTCNYYFTDIDNVFDDERRYPKKDLPDPFIAQYTDMLNRTDAYTAAMTSDTAIASRYITMLTAQEKITFVVTTRDTNGEILYDLSVGITRSEP